MASCSMRPAEWWDRRSGSPKRLPEERSARATSCSSWCSKACARSSTAMVPLVKQVMKQTRARIFRGDTHAEGKILSLFEPSTEIIRKGKAGKPNEFGKMVKLQEA